jgi:hypothetical protein
MASRLVIVVVIVTSILLVYTQYLVLYLGERSRLQYQVLRVRCTLLVSRDMESELMREMFVLSLGPILITYWNGDHRNEAKNSTTTSTLLILLLTASHHE